MNDSLQEPVTSPLAAEDVLARVRQLYAQLQLLREAGTNQHSAAYTALEAEIRVWADRYSKISKTGDLPAR